MRRRRLHQNQNTESHGSTLMVMLLVALVPILALVNILLSAQVSDLGFKMDELYRSQDELTDQNHDLEQEIFRKSALTIIHKEAENLGFSNENEYVSVRKNLPVAFKSE